MTEPTPHPLPPAPGEQAEPWEGPLLSMGRSVARALRRTEQIDTRINELAQVIIDLAEKLTAAPPANAADDNGPAGPAGPARAEGPGVRSWLLADDPAQADADLADLTVWVWRVYLWWPDAWLSSCWLWHPEVIEELWWLRVAHADAYAPQDRDGAGGSRTGTTGYRPGVVRRVRGDPGQVRAEPAHPVQRPPGRGHPTPPARAWPATLPQTSPRSGLRAPGLEGAVRATGPQPTPEQFWPRLRLTRTRLYRSRTMTAAARAPRAPGPDPAVSPGAGLRAASRTGPRAVRRQWPGPSATSTATSGWPERTRHRSPAPPRPVTSYSRVRQLARRHIDAVERRRPAVRHLSRPADIGS